MITIKNLSFKYDKKDVFLNTNLNINENNFYGLLGKNGVGKTTLMELCIGLKSYQNGSIKIDDYNPFDKNPIFLSNQFYLPERPEMIHMKAIDFASEYGIFWNKFNLDIFKNICLDFEVDINQKMNNMSTGQLKKTWIALALACQVKYYYFDEPTNGLDIPSKIQFKKILIKYVADQSIVIISTHQVKDIDNIINYVIILDDYHISYNGSMDSINKQYYFDYEHNYILSESLYAEQTPNGYIQIHPNINNQSSKIDLESFFNMVTQNSHRAF